MNVLPDDWEVSRLEKLGSASIGLTFSPSAIANDGTLVLRSSNIQNEKLAFVDNVYVDMEVPASSFVKPGDILICARNGSRQLIGKSVLLDERARGMAFGAFMAVFRSDFNDFLIHQFRSSAMRSQIEMHLGATINQITNASLLSFEVPFPSSARERKAIAEALSDADAAIESLDALIAKKRDVKQAAMQQLLTGRTRLPGFSADWKEVRLGEFCEFVQTIALSRSQLEADNGVGCIHYGDIHTKFHDRLDCSSVRLPMSDSGLVSGVPRLKVGDLVLADASEDMAGVGKSIEIMRVLDNGVVAGLHTAVLRPRSGFLAKGFFGQLQHMPKFKEQARVLASGLKVYGLSKTSISKITVDLPPLKEQEAIAEALSVMDDELKALTEQVSKLRMVKEGMMQDLLTGKVRLV